VEPSQQVLAVAQDVAARPRDLDPHPGLAGERRAFLRLGERCRKLDGHRLHGKGAPERGDARASPVRVLHVEIPERVVARIDARDAQAGGRRLEKLRFRRWQRARKQHLADGRESPQQPFEH
jgi:hypothetical protein